MGTGETMNYSLARNGTEQADIDQLKTIRAELDKRIEMAQTYVTLWSIPQARVVITATQSYLADVGDMCARKIGRGA